MCIPCTAPNISAPRPLATTRSLTCSTMMSRTGRSWTPFTSSLQCMINTRTPCNALRKSCIDGGFFFCRFRAGRERGWGWLVNLNFTTSPARVVSSSTKCSGVKWPYSVSSSRPDGQEHSINIDDNVSGILGAAARQTLMVCGFSAKMSGSTSPKNRNSRELGSCRMKNAADS